jgi:hypothetical protein
LPQDLVLVVRPVSVRRAALVLLVAHRVHRDNQTVVGGRVVPDSVQAAQVLARADREALGAEDRVGSFVAIDMDLTFRAYPRRN